MLDEDTPPSALAADVLVLSSWAPAYELLLEQRRGGSVVARWHSSLLQTELSREGWKLALLLDFLDAGRLGALAADDADVVDALARPDVVHFPDVLDLAEFEHVVALRLEGTNVSLPGEPHGRKNLLVQAAAFERARRGRDWTLHLFGQTRRRRWYARWLELSGVPYVDHGFLPRDEYLTLVAGMDAGLCASVAESFGYAPAEHAVLGVPVVVSRAIRALEAGPLTIDDPSSVADVATGLERALVDSAAAAEQRRALRRRCVQNEQIARAALRALAAGRVAR